MYSLTETILNWAEVWALLIPLFVLAVKRRQPAFLRPVIIYLWVALFLNLAGDIIGDFKRYLPTWMHSNNVLYNVHSVARFICFSYFFRMLGNRFRNWFDKLMVLAALIFLIINFIFIENIFDPDHLSGNLLTTEAYILMIYCIQYYLSELRDDSDAFSRKKVFWIVTGLSIYVVVNFFVFLFYVPMLTQDPNLADNMWNVHNLAYIILCIFVAIAFYVPA